VLQIRDVADRAGIGLSGVDEVWDPRSRIGTRGDVVEADSRDDDGGVRGGLPSVAVVVATYRRPERLERLVHATLEDRVVSEMHVVVDGCRDGSLEILEALAADEPRLHPMFVEHRGQFAALGRGLSVARGEVVLLLDDDVVPGFELASRHARRHAGVDGLVVVGYMPVDLPQRRRAGQVARFLYAREYETHCEEIESGEREVLDGLWFGNVSLRRGVFDRVSLESTSFANSYFADRDFGLRLKRAGLTGVFDRRLFALHLHERAARAFLRDALVQGVDTVQLHRDHPDLLGGLDLEASEAGLGPVLRLVVRALGPTPAALGMGRVLMGIGDGCSRLHLFSLETRSAKLARRLCQRRGIAVALKEPRGASAQVARNFGSGRSFGGPVRSR